MYSYLFISVLITSRIINDCDVDLYPAVMSASIRLPVWHILHFVHMQHGFILRTSCNLLSTTACGNKETDSVWSQCDVRALFPFFILSAGSLVSVLSDSLPFWVLIERVSRQERSDNALYFVYEWPLKCSTKCHLGLHQLRYTM